MGDLLVPSVVVTSFSLAGAKQYGLRMVESVLQYWPQSTQVVVYPDKPVGILGQLVWPDGFRRCEERRTTDLADWMACRQRWASDPLVHGRATAARRQSKPYLFRYDAARFAVKLFVMRDAAQRLGEGCLTWLDADTLTIGLVPEGWAEGLLADADVAYLGRGGMYPETGYIGFRIPQAMPLLNWCCERYESERFRALPGWTDCDVLQAGLAAVPIRAKDWTSERYCGDSHIWPVSPLAPYVMHFKGWRKRSRRKRIVA